MGTFSRRDAGALEDDRVLAPERYRSHAGAT